MHWLNMFHQIKIRISIIISVTLALCIQIFGTEIHIRLQSLCNSHRERETHRHIDTYITLIWGINPRVLKQKPNFTHKNFSRERKGMFFFVIGIPLSLVEHIAKSDTSDHVCASLQGTKIPRIIQIKTNLCNYLDVFFTHRACMAATLCCIHIETSWILKILFAI